MTNKSPDLATPSDRAYDSVAKMIAGEQLPQAVRDHFEAFREASALTLELAKMRQHAGLTQSQMAERIGRSQSAISKLENSDDETVTVKDLLEYARATEVQISLMIGPQLSHVQLVKFHAFALRDQLRALARLAREYDEFERDIQAFFGEAFFNILGILSKCQAEMPGQSELQISFQAGGIHKTELRQSQRQQGECDDLQSVRT